MLRQQKINQFPIVILTLACLFVVFVFGCAPQDQKSESSTKAEVKQKTEADSPEAVIKPADGEKKEPEATPEIDPANAIAVIETAKGNIEFEFYATDAPKTSKTFIQNASRGYYKNEHFHSVEELFIQAGSTFANGTLPIEKSEHPLEKGVVLMAKEPGANVSDADEFFICKDAIALDEDYTILGKVIKGLEVLDTIERHDKIVNITIRERDKE